MTQVKLMTNLNQNSTTHLTAWQRTRNEQRALHALTRAIADDPASLADAVRVARTEGFASLDDLLLAAHAEWVRTFDARIDVLLEAGSYGDQVAFDAVWAETARALPGTALLLDHHAEHPAVVRAHAQHVRRAQHVLAVDLPSTWAVAQRPRRRRSCVGRLGRLPRLRVA